jgi:tyrosinase
MTTSRREVLLQGCVIGAGMIAANMTGIEALAQGAPKLRRSLHGMALNDPILQTWRDGVRLLKAASGNVSWANFAAIHGNTQQFNLCPHGTWYFLPWHRAYLLSYERAVRQLTGNNDFALPYWDWTEDRQMPAGFVAPIYNGQPNPLFESQRDATPTDSLPDSAVGPGVINQILTQTPFETFGTSRPVGQNNVDQSWINCEFCGTKGILEETPHDLVHGFVGGIMGQANSALDPLFMMHHCNIDRIWWTWNQGGGPDSLDPLWSGMTFQNNFFNPDGTPYSPQVSDLLIPEPLGYTYVDTPLAAAPTASLASAVVGQSEKFKSLYTVSNLATAKPSGVASYAASVENPAATVDKYLEIPVDVDANALAPVAHRKSPPSGFEALSLSNARQQYLTGARCYAFLRDVDYAEQANTEYRVFLNCDYLSAGTPTTDRHYVGSFGFFGSPGAHGGHGGHGGMEPRKPSLGIDLTSTIQRVYGSAATPPAKLRVQIQPVALRPSGKAQGTVKPSRVEVAIVSA